MHGSAEGEKKVCVGRMREKEGNKKVCYNDEEGR